MALEATCEWGTKAEVVLVKDTEAWLTFKIQNAECADQVAKESADAVYAKTYRLKKRVDGKYSFKALFGFVPDVFTFVYDK